MKRLFVTGDTHCGIDIHKLNSDFFNPVGLTKDDILIILGDAGFVWCNDKEERYWRTWLDNKPWTTFCVLGNHENYDLIEKLPTVDFMSAKAYKVSNTVYYAQTGEIYNLCGKKCLVVNGADSIDKKFRKEGISWWKQERITKNDISKALTNLQKVNNEVDFILSHTGGSEVCKMLNFYSSPSDDMLDIVLNKAHYANHYCGHYHVDKICHNTKVLFNDVIMIACEEDKNG